MSRTPRIMIVGAGQSGLATATGLLKSEVEVGVDVFTLHSTQEILEGPPRLTQLTFPTVHQLERESGLDFWDQISPVFRQIRLSIAPLEGQGQSFTGRLQGLGTSVDHRAKTAKWLQDVESRGARIHAQTVRPEELTWFATRGLYDLVLVASGAGERHLAELFPLKHRGSKRAVIQAHFEGHPPGPDVQVTTTPYGEVFAYPTLTEFESGPGQFEVTAGTAVQIYAHADGPMDPATAGLAPSHRPARLTHIWDFAYRQLCEHTPDLAEWTAQAPLVPRSRLLRYVTPEVRDPVTTIQGTPILGIGDAVLSVDPTSGQGANASTRIAATLAPALAERIAHDQPLAEATFLQSVTQRFHEEYGQYTGVFADLVTDFWSQTLDQQVMERFAGNFTDQAQANRMVTGWDDPSTLGWLLTP